MKLLTLVWGLLTVMAWGLALFPVLLYALASRGG